MTNSPETIRVWIDISVGAEEQGIIEGEWDNSKPNDDDEVAYIRQDISDKRIAEAVKTALRHGALSVPCDCFMCTNDTP
jgi:hypothetical protein